MRPCRCSRPCTCSSSPSSESSRCCGRRSVSSSRPRFMAPSTPWAGQWSPRGWCSRCRKARRRCSSRSS
ncbi:hypothetical protein D7V88_30985 [Corallococcus terminator]|uniref:Uncharacterized protein n=1 Tax=Corallococcus terminator TaxID=2316733 RepID=A0A3A8I2S0_9BACT|nr:hypothetical protein D7V88_30985 [Corallococcus terminator]